MERLSYRHLELLGQEQLPLRGPVVIVSTARELVVRRLLKRPTAQVFELKMREADGERQACAYPWLANGVSLPWRHTAIDLWVDQLRGHLNAALLVWVLVEEAPALDALAGALLEADMVGEQRLGFNVLVADSKISEPRPLRADLWVRLQPLRGWHGAQQNDAKEPRAARLGLSQSLRAQVRFPADLLNEDEIFLEKLERLKNLNFDTSQELKADPAMLQPLLPILKRCRQAPEQLERLKSATRQLWNHVQSLGIRDRGFYVHQSLLELRKKILSRFAWRLPIFIVGLLGIAQHYVAYKIPEWIEFWTHQRLASANVWRALMILPVYLTQYWLVDALFGSVASLFYLASLPISGFVGLMLLESRESIWDHLELLKLINQQRAQQGALKTQLLNQRWELLENFAAFTGQTEGSHEPEFLQQPESQEGRI